MTLFTVTALGRTEPPEERIKNKNAKKKKKSVLLFLVDDCLTGPFLSMLFDLFCFVLPSFFTLIL